MAKVPVLRGSPKVPLLKTVDGVKVPAVADDPCTCCDVPCTEGCNGFGATFTVPADAKYVAGSYSLTSPFEPFGVTCPAGSDCEHTGGFEDSGHADVAVVMCYDIDAGKTFIYTFDSIFFIGWRDEFDDPDGAIFCGHGGTLSLAPAVGSPYGDNATITF